MVFLALVGCSSSSTPVDPTPTPAADSGPDAPATSGVFTRGTDTFSGFPFTPTDGAAYPKAEDGAVGGVHSSMRIAIADRASICANGYDRAGATRLVLQIESAATSPAAGTYTVGTQDADGNLTAEIEILDASCKASGDGAHYVAMSGTLVLSSVTATAIKGQLDVVLLEGGTLSAAIDVPICSQAEPDGMTCPD